MKVLNFIRDASLCVREIAMKKLPYSKSALLILVLLVLCSGVLQHKVETKLRHDIKVSIESILLTTQQALTSWRNEQINTVATWANMPEVIDATKALLSASETNLNDHQAQLKLRKVFGHVLESKDYLGYFIIGPDNTNLASFNNQNIGHVNLLTEQPGFLQRLWAGEGSMSVPMKSDVVVPGRDTLEQSHSLFVGAPIYNKEGKVIALFTFRLDPRKVFNEIVKRGRLSDTGETYAFNRKGVMLTESRFEEELHSLGILKDNESAMLNLQLLQRDTQIAKPGLLPTFEHRFTEMVTRATSGETASNLNGYIDYRGKKVIGSWLWNRAFDFGLVTEIDYDEAYGSLKFVKLIINLLTAISMILLIGLWWGFVYSRNQMIRSERQKLKAQRQAAKAKVLDREQFYRQVLDSSAEGIITVDNDGLMTHVNAASESLFGYAAQEMKGQPATLLVLPKDRNKYLNYLTSVLKGTTSSENKDGIELMGCCKSGKVFPVNLSIGKSTLNDEFIYTGIIRDLSEKKAAEDKLRKLSYAIEQSPASIVISNVEGDVEYVNKNFTKITGYQPEDVIGKSAKRFKAIEMSEEENRAQWNLLTSGRTWRDVHESVKKNGDMYWESEKVTAIKDEQGNIVNILSTRTDITERKRFQDELHKARREANQAKIKAIEASQAKSEFLANMSHEIRTPLNGILGISYLLGKTELDSAQQEFMDKIASSSEMLLGIINNILDFSKIEAGKVELEQVNFPLSKVLDNLRNVLATPLEDKGLRLIFEVADDVPENLCGDPLRLGQVLINLTNNALKFTERGEIKVSITLDSSFVSHRDHLVKLKCVVSDTGIGMTSDQVTRLFNPFTQADGSTTRKYGGTGLGLTICKQLINLMGGDIRVSSALDVGSRFEFEVNLNRALGAGESKDAPVMLMDISGSHILLVDDHPINQEIAAGILREAGLLVSIASNGEEAVAKVKHQRFDLVLMDIQMPVMDGYQATRVIRNQLKLTDLPIIAMTANAMSEDKARCLDVGMNDHLPKPIDPKGVIARIQHWLSLVHGANSQRITPLKAASVIEVDETLSSSQSGLPSKQDGSAQEQSKWAIEGFDHDALAERLSHDFQLLMTLLQQFLDDFKGIDVQAKLAFIKGDNSTAYQYIHRVTGICGNLAMSDLHASALKLEAELNDDNQLSSSESWEVFSNQLSRYLKVITQFLEQQQSGGLPELSATKKCAH
jgi:polar amino acid transport system substrate-binding protein